MAASSSSSSKRSGEPQEDVVDHMGRKVWDKDYYIEKAKENIMFGPVRIGKRKDPVIPLPASQRTYLKARDIDLQLEKDLGKSKVVTAQTIKPLQGGYWCSVCECLLKDSSTYLEHVNGRRHNRNLGMNMKVEKIGADRVREKLQGLKNQPEAAEPEDVAARLQALEEDEQAKKRRKKEQRKKKKKQGDGEGEGEEAEGGDGEGGADGGKEEQAPKADAEKGSEKTGDGEPEDDDDDDMDEELQLLKQMGLPTGFS